MFRVVTYSEAAEQLAALPAHLLADYARVLDAITAAPWDGAPHNANNPDAEVRRWLFGPLGMAQVLGDRSVLVAAGAGLSLEGVAAAQLIQCTRRSSTRRRSCSRTR